MKRWKTRQRYGMSIIEVVLALGIFLMMTIMVAAMIPAAARSARYSSSYAQAANIGNRKVEQLIEAGFSKLDYTNMLNLGVISASQTAPVNINDTSVPANAMVSVTYTFTGNTTQNNANNPDNLQEYFPNGVVGTIEVEPWQPSVKQVNGVDEPTLRLCTVTLTWRDGGGAQQSFSTATLISKMTLN